MTDAWNPRCTSLRAEGGSCSYVELGVTALVAEPDDWLRRWTWTCPVCGGASFEWVPDSVAKPENAIASAARTPGGVSGAPL
jgi:hypothetical protein